MFFRGGQTEKKKNSLYFEKDKRNVVACEICQKGFMHIIAPKHKCKRCYRYICGSCGKNKAIVNYFTAKYFNKTLRSFFKKKLYITYC